MLMEPIIIVFIKLMGAAISGHWDLRDTGTTRDYDTLARACTSHSRQSVMLRPVTAKRANNQGEKVHISNSSTPNILILVSGDS